MKKTIAMMLAAIFSLSLLVGCEEVPPAADPVYPDETQNIQNAAEPAGMTVYFLDVGQADSILLECDGEYMLVDAGNRADGSPLVDYLNNMGVDSLKIVIGTHPHEDHIGGMPDVLENIEVESYWMPEAIATTSIFETVLDLLDEKSIQVQFPQSGNSAPLGSATVEVLGPLTEYDDLNDASIVVKVTCGDVSFLLTGDQTTTAEDDLLAEGIDVSATVLKMGHHGSSTSSGQEFFDAVDPELAIITCGADNDYGHPHKEIVSLLNRSGIEVHRTDVEGTIIVTTDGQTWSVSTGESVNSDGVTQVAESTNSEGTYIGNKNSKVIHSEDCSGLPSEKNQVVFTSLDDALAEGYTICGNCKAE